MSQATPEAPQPAVPQIRPTATTIAYYGAFIALGLSLATLGPTLPALAGQTGVTLKGISYLFTTRSLGYLLGSLNGGRLFDRMPGHALIASTLVATAVLLALVPQATTLWFLCTIMFFLGAAEATVDVGGNVLLVWIHRDNLGPYMNALHFFFGVGALISPIIVGQVVAATGGISWAYWLVSLLVLPPAVALFRLRSPSNPVHSDEAKPVRTRPLLVFLLSFCFFLIVGAEVGFADWLYTYALEMGLATESAAAYLTSAFWGAFTIGRLVMIPIASRLRPSTILVGDLIGCILGIGIIASWPNDSTFLWVGTAVFGLAIASVFATLFSLANDHLSISGSMTSWFFVGTSAGAMALPWTIGQFFESSGPPVTTTVIMVDLLIALVVFGAALLYARARPAADTEASGANA
jgi:MFS transporter, FHS family, Na+ dependent glucose transporter 1